MIDDRATNPILDMALERFGARSDAVNAGGHIKRRRDEFLALGLNGLPVTLDELKPVLNGIATAALDAWHKECVAAIAGVDGGDFHADDLSPFGALVDAVVYGIRLGYDLAHAELEATR